MLHNLHFNEQIQEIGRLANTRQVNRSDRYLAVYPVLLEAIQGLLPLTRSKLLLAAHAVFGWMPTQLKLNMTRLDKAHAALAPVLQNGADVSVNDLSVLASTFQTTNGNSVVAASKILHFLAPDRFPIWDRLVAKTWGLPASGSNAPANYHGFVVSCRRFAGDAVGQQACDVLRQRLAQAGYEYPMTNIRLLELIFFLGPETSR